MKKEEIGLKKIVSNISWSLAEKLLTDAVGLIITIVLARLLFPEDYGDVVLVQVYINIASIFVGTGLGTALIQKKDATETQISTIFYVNIFVGLILYAIVFTIAPFLSSIGNNSELCALLRVLAIKIPLASAYSIQHSYIKKRMQFKRFFYSSLAGTLVSAVVGISMAYMGFGPWALVASNLVDQVMDMTILFITTKWFPKFTVNIKESWTIIKFGLKILVTEFISRTYAQLRSLIIGIKYSTADLAFNSKGQKFPQMVSDLSDSMITRVMFPVLSESQDDKDRMAYVVKTTIQMSLFILAPMTIGLAAVSDRFVPLLLTDKWQGVTPYMRVFCVLYLLHPLLAMNSQVIHASGRGNLLIKMQTVQTIIGLSTIAFVIFVFNTPISISYSLLLTDTINVLIEMYLSKMLIGYGPIEQIKDIGPTLLISFVMGITVYFVGFLSTSNVIGLILQIVVGVVIYVGLSLGLKTEPTMFMLRSAKKIRK